MSSINLCEDKSAKNMAKAKKASNDDFEYDILNNEADDYAPTIIIERYVDSPSQELHDGTIFEERDVSQDTMDMSIEDFDDHENVFKEDNKTSAQISRAQPSNIRTPPFLVCQICLTEFDTKEEVRAHSETHYLGSDLVNYLDITERPFLCTHCNEIQLNKPQLVKHHRRHLKINPYKCKHPGCSYESVGRDGLKSHRVVHSAPTRACDQCGVSFRRRSDLVSHMARHHPTAALARLATHVCGTCGLRTSDAKALRRHMHAHHLAPSYSCPHGSCSRTYRSRRALHDHEHAHRTGVRRYRCAYCNRTDFTNNRSLNWHKQQHELSKRTHCDRCPAAFEEYSAFYRHRIAHHGHFAGVYCRACPHQYPTEAQLIKHEETCENLKSLILHELKEEEQEQENTEEEQENGEEEQQNTEDEQGNTEDEQGNTEKEQEQGNGEEEQFWVTEDLYTQETVECKDSDRKIASYLVTLVEN